MESIFANACKYVAQWWKEHNTRKGSLYLNDLLSRKSGFNVAVHKSYFFKDASHLIGWLKCVKIWNTVIKQEKLSSIPWFSAEK